MVVTSLTGAFETELIEALLLGLKNLLNSSSFSISLLIILSNSNNLELLAGSADAAGMRTGDDGVENVTFFAGRDCGVVDERVGEADSVDEVFEGVEGGFVDERIGGGGIVDEELGSFWVAVVGEGVDEAGAFGG